MPEQLASPAADGTRHRPQRGPARYRIGSRMLEVTECFDVYWGFAAQRQRI